MAAIRRKHGQVAVACSASVLFCNTGDYQGWHSVKLPEVKREEKDDDEDQKQNGNAGNRVLALAFSPTGQYLAVCDDQKQLHVYKAGQEWTLASTRSVVRRGKSLVFTENGKTVLLADKSGDVYTFSVEESDREGELTHGHLSMVLDMVLAHDDSYVVTCDRDEKIRVSNFPNSYNIYSFCLGHTDFVTSLVYIEDGNILVSGSGDMTIRSWTLEGKQLDSVHATTEANADLPDDADLRPAVKKLTYCAKHKILAAAFHGYPCVELYSVSAEGQLSHIQTLQHKIVPWDACFDDDDYLWVLLPQEGNSLELYQVVTEDDSCKLSAVSSDEGPLSQARKDLNSKWDMMKDCLDIKNIIPTLWKQRIDNMADYLKRKEERLAGTKPGGNNSDGGSLPPEKIAKKS